MSQDPEGPPVERSTLGQIGRPRRLAIAEIVTAAIELADEHGLEELSMPKLAKRLGVGTMTLYGYVTSKEDLVDRMAERIFDDLHVPTVDNWQQGMVRFFSDFRRAALAHPSLARLLATGRITIPAVFDILETFFQQMTADGVSIEDAVRTFYAALSYTIGFVLWEIPRVHIQPEAEYASQWASLVAELNADQYPLLTGIATGVTPTVASNEQFEWGLERLVVA